MLVNEVKKQNYLKIYWPMSLYLVNCIIISGKELEIKHKAFI